MGHRSNSCRFSGHFVEIPGFAKNSEPSGGEPTPSHHENLLENPFSYPRLQGAFHHQVDFHSQGFREPELQVYELYESYGPFELHEDIKVALWGFFSPHKGAKNPNGPHSVLFVEEEFEGSEFFGYLYKGGSVSFHGPRSIVPPVSCSVSWCYREFSQGFCACQSFKERHKTASETKRQPRSSTCTLSLRAKRSSPAAFFAVASEAKQSEIASPDERARLAMTPSSVIPSRKAARNL